MRSCLLVAGFVACAACARPAPRAAAPNVVTITATDYAFSAPDTIPAGLTTLRLVNRGKELHHASLVRLGAGKTIADFQAGLQAAMQNHTPPPPWISFAGGPNAVTVGDTAQATQALAPGLYVLACWIPSADGAPHIMKGMMPPVGWGGGRGREQHRPPSAPRPSRLGTIWSCASGPTRRTGSRTWCTGWRSRSL